MSRVPDAPWIGNDRYNKKEDEEEYDEDFAYESQRDEELLEELLKGE